MKKKLSAETDVPPLTIQLKLPVTRGVTGALGSLGAGLSLAHADKRNTARRLAPNKILNGVYIMN